MFEIVDEVNVVFQLPRPYVRLLLIACKWDKEKLLERLVNSQSAKGLVSYYVTQTDTMQGTKRHCSKRLMWCPPKRNSHDKMSS